MKFKIEQSSYSMPPPRKYYFSHIKYNTREVGYSYKQIGQSVFYIIPFGYIIRIVHRVFLNFKIFNCWIPWKFKRIKRDIKFIKEAWGNA